MRSYCVHIGIKENLGYIQNKVLSLLVLLYLNSMGTVYSCSAMTNSQLILTQSVLDISMKQFSMNLVNSLFV